MFLYLKYRSIIFIFGTIDIFQCGSLPLASCSFQSKLKRGSWRELTVSTTPPHLLYPKAPWVFLERHLPPSVRRLKRARLLWKHFFIVMRQLNEDLRWLGDLTSLWGKAFHPLRMKLPFSHVFIHILQIYSFSYISFISPRFLLYERFPSLSSHKRSKCSWGSFELLFEWNHSHADE